MKERIKNLVSDFEEKIIKVDSLPKLEDLRLELLGKKGVLTEILKSLRDLSPEEKPIVGGLVNEARKSIESKINNAAKNISFAERNKKIMSETIDVTMPGKVFESGAHHPLNIVKNILCNIFIGMGFEIADGPEIETEYYNFSSLNIPEGHPARDDQDTFYFDGEYLLRTATSPVQVRVMEKGNLPIKIIVPGRVYRSDQIDATHSPVFHQLEGLVVDEGITFADLKGSLEIFAKEFFGNDTKVRFRPHYFPFTEPSAEMDISCFVCKGKGCRVCKNSGYIEILGSGLVHRKVLQNAGIDPDKYSGYAFGMGIDRLTMQRFGITDLRLLYENDVRLLKQFS